MIRNFECYNCKSQPVCSIKKVLDKFTEDAKKQLGVDLTMDNCQNYIPFGEDTEDTETY